MAEAKWSGVLSTTEPRNDVGIIKVRQGNVNSEIVEFQIVQNNKPYDLTGLTVYFCASFGLNLVEKPAVVINTTGGRIQYTFDDDSMQSVGRQKGYFSFKKAENKIDSTQDFEFRVESSLMTRSIDGKSYIYKLSTLIKVLDDFIKNGQNNFNTWFDSVKEILYGVDPGGNILRELIEARKNSSGSIFASLKARLDKNEDDTAAQLAQTETTLSETRQALNGYINLVEHGAVLDGITDDSAAFESALAVGNVTVPANSRVFIGKTVHITNPQRIINGNESIFIGGANVVMFQIGSVEMFESLLNIKIQNMFVSLINSASFLLSYSSYFQNFDNIRLTGLKDSNFGLKFINGFNIFLKEVNIGGADSGIDNISGNHAKGITFEPIADVNQGVIGTTNLTNIKTDSCLIQGVEHGVFLGNGLDTFFDTNVFTNMGFSNVDNVITTFENCVNLKIKGIRAEFCGVLFDNNGDIYPEDVYCYETNYAMFNKVSGRIILKSAFYHWNPNKQGGYIIKDNLGTISFKDVGHLNHTPTVMRCQNSYGRILQKKALEKGGSTKNLSATLAIDEFEIRTYDQTNYLDFANITGINGSEFYIFSSSGSEFLLPNSILQQNSIISNLMLQCKIIDGKILVLGQENAIYKKTITDSASSSTQQAIKIVDAKNSLNQFTFSGLGITVLYSSVQGVTLSNGGLTILNFHMINSSNPIDLYNNPLILIPAGDGTHGYVIKS